MAQGAFTGRSGWRVNRQTWARGQGPFRFYGAVSFARHAFYFDTMTLDNLRICPSDETDELNGPGAELGNTDPAHANGCLKGPPSVYSASSYPLTCGRSPDNASGPGSRNRETSAHNAGRRIAKPDPVTSAMT